MIKELIKRYLPKDYNNFETQIIETVEGKDCLEYYSFNDKIILRGNNNISLAMAFYEYLKAYLNVNISWCGERIDDYEVLPMPSQRYYRVIEQKYRAYMNYCTFSYSCAWWDWERWSQEIDFMAMRGINMPLVIVGLEKVWYNTLLKFGFTSKESLEFLSSPAYMAWQLMNNLEGEYSPSSVETVNRRYELGKKIIDKMVAYGMMPIQQGFSGCVPRLLAEKVKDATIRMGKKWCGYKGTAQLDPTDKLFVAFGKTLLQEQDSLFGSYHYYASDPFHESSPPVKGKEYLNKVSSTICNMFESFDKQYTWVMQGWTPYKDIITTVPKERLIILDLNGKAHKKYDKFYGYRVILGNLHNFGGRINLHGDMRYIANNPYIKAKTEGVNVVGTGLFMEGINQNPMYYDLSFDMISSSEKICLNNWLNDYARRRYGNDKKHLAQTLKILSNTVYKRFTNDVENSSIICARPALSPKKSGPNNGFRIPYRMEKLKQALRIYANCYDESDKNYCLKFDLIDVARQYMSNLGQKIIKKARLAYVLKNKYGYQKLTNRYLKLLLDVDSILSHTKELSFYEWQKSALELGITENEKADNLSACKQLVTVWGPTDKNGGEPEIFDYAWREWAGLIKHFYYIRWKKFFEYAYDCLENKVPLKELTLPKQYGREAFRANNFYDKLADFEINFVNNNATIAPPSKVNSIIDIINSIL